MKCAVHTEVDAKGYCRNCGKALCEACTRDVKGVLYCEECLAGIVTSPPPAARAPGAGSPGLATVLGFVPALGAVYNGEYMKALIHFLIFATLVTMADHGVAEPLPGLMIGAFIVYMAIEANQTAKAKLQGCKPTSPFTDIGVNQPVGAYLLIGVGVLFLLGQVEIFPWEKIVRFGLPLGLIILGLFLLRRRLSPPTEEKQP